MVVVIVLLVIYSLSAMNGAVVAVTVASSWVVGRVASMAVDGLSRRVVAMSVCVVVALAISMLVIVGASVNSWRSVGKNREPTAMAMTERVV